MTGAAWARSARRPAARSWAPRSLEAFGIALELARQRWDGLTLGANGGRSATYSDEAAAAVLGLALALWPTVSAELGGQGLEDG